MGNKPEYKVFGRSENKSGLGKSWVHMGAGWVKGESISITISAMPLDFTGHMMLHPWDKKPKDDDDDSIPF